MDLIKKIKNYKQQLQINCDRIHPNVIEIHLSTFNDSPLNVYHFRNRFKSN